jgi:TolA-binding protein
LRRIADEVPPAVERRFRDSLDRYRSGDRALARTTWADLLEGAPRGALAETLRYLLARDLFRNPEGPGSLRSAEGHLRHMLESPSVLWRPEALVLLGEILQGRGASEEARGLWAEVLEGFGEDSGPAGRARELLGGAKSPLPQEY